MVRVLLSVLLGFLGLGFSAKAQELNCEVEVNANKLANTSKEMFTSTLKTAIQEYMNDNKWTDAQFAQNEKIECKLYLTISSYNDATGLVSADLQLQSSRPVYNSSYTTPLINFKDTKVDFTYQENNPLVYSETDMQDNLTAILNFWAFMIIGIDFDTFSLNGGAPYFERAAQVVRMAQSSGESGWRAFEDSKNRNAVLSVFTERATNPIHEVYYSYHRMGLDQMVVSPDKGRQQVTHSIDLLKQIYDAAPMSVALSMFKDSKLDELVNIYSKAGLSEKQNVYEQLYPIYPSETSRLNKIKQEDTTR